MRCDQIPQGGLCHHFVGDGFFIGMAVGFAFGEDMPGGNQQAAGDRHDGFIGVLGLGQALVLGFPIGIAAHGTPGRLNQSPTQFLATCFGDRLSPGVSDR